MSVLETMTPKQRSVYMAKIRGRDTKPETVIRAFLASANIKFETYAEDLPGTPDIVARDARVAVFVHGCFWHQHGCRRNKPKVNRVFWAKKFETSIADARAAEYALRADGWRVLTVWECQDKKKSVRQRLLDLLAKGRQVCHDCSNVAVPEYVHCQRCRHNYAGSSSNVNSLPRVKDDTRVATTRRRRRSLGLCPPCGMPAGDGRAMCPAHAAKSRTTQSSSFKSTYQKLAEKGECRCHAPVRPGSTRCEKCLRKMRREAKKRNLRYKTLGRCRRCPKTALPGKVYCVGCSTKALATNAKALRLFIKRRRDAELCVRCAGPSKTYHCQECRKKIARKVRKRKGAHA